MSETTKENKMNKVSESIYSDDSVVIPLAEVLFIEKHYYGTPSEYKGIRIIFKGTRWDMDADTWSNNAYISDIDNKHEKFLKAWCFYRHEIEGMEKVTNKITTDKELP